MAFNRNLRHRIRLQRQCEEQDETTGAVEVVWRDFATLWAAIEPVSVREFVASQSEQSQVNTRIVIRYYDGVEPKMRAFHEAKSTYYNIEGVMSDVDSGLEYLTLACSAGVRYLPN